MVSATAREAAVPDHIDTFVRYSERAADGGYIEANEKYSFEMEDHPARVANARLADTSWEANGFALLKHPIDINFADPEDVKARYYPEAARLVRELTGASEVFPFLGILRGGEQKLGGGPALSAHVDFNGPMLRDWIGRLVPDRAAELSAKRLVNINLWRGTKPVENFPLALCDARSVEKGDFLRVRLGKSDEPVTDDTPCGLNMAYNPAHRWYYFPMMQPDEVLAFRLFDTANPEWKMTGHTAIEDPTSAPGSPKRESFELRTIAVFDA